MSTRQERTQAYLDNVARRRLRAASPLSLGASLAAWWDPTDVTTLFQDSAGTTPVTAVGDPVGLMRDKSGNDNHLSQATAAARPLWQADGSLLFDGVDDCMLLTGVVFFAAAAPGEVFAIVRQDLDAGADTTNRTMFGTGGGSTAVVRRMQRVVPSGMNVFRSNTGDGATAITPAVTTVDFSGVHVVRSRFGATETSTYIAGQQVTLPVVPATGTARTRIGANSSAAAGELWSGKIGAMVVVEGAATTEQEKTLRDYFSLQEMT